MGERLLWWLVVLVAMCRYSGDGKIADNKAAGGTTGGGTTPMGLGGSFGGTPTFGVKER